MGFEVGKPVIILGAGGHAKVLIDALQQLKGSILLTRILRVKPSWEFLFWAMMTKFWTIPHRMFFWSMA
jgi:hypothetical protein